ncbi:MAG: serine/threonine protein kinase [Anaerolineae bacterium]|nr:MAG: serine/threonine protein kinase [Anaerolineae bacterium]
MNPSPRLRKILLNLLVGAIILIVLVEPFRRFSASPSLPGLISELQWSAIIIAFAVVGGIILARHPGQRIGVFMLILPIGLAAGLILEAIVSAIPNGVTALTPFQYFAVWFSSWSWWFLILPLPLIALYFPTGELLSRGWRWGLVCLFTAFGAFHIVALLAAEWSELDGTRSWPGPFPLLSEEQIEPLVIVMGILLLTSIALAVMSMIARYRRAELVERAQIRWLMFFFALFFGVYLITFFSPDEYRQRWLVDAAMTLSIIGIPLSIGFAILRYRLYQIDVAINRSLVLGVVIIVLAIPFAAAFFGVRALLAGMLEPQHDTMVVAFSTLAAGLLFNPTYRWARDLIDRRFYGLRFNLLDLDVSQKAPDTGARGHHTGQTLGKYKLHDLLGKGGMGEVYRASDNGNTLAVKILPGSAVDLPEHLARFSREARLTLSLQHPNIVRMLDYGEDAGTAFMAMEYVEGDNLTARLHADGPLSLEETRAVIRQVAAALDYAHQSGFIHRDIKPGNIMLRKRADGGTDAVLMDFGVAKVKESRSMLTGTGMVGTIDYMAPEQIRESTAVDARADVYALGLVAYEMLAGQPAFKGSPAQVMFMHLTQPPPDIRALQPGIPAAAAEAILLALAKDPAERFDSAGAFASALG